jgi:hypothetical protein
MAAKRQSCSEKTKITVLLSVHNIICSKKIAIFFVSLRDDKSPVAFPDLFDRSVEVRTPYIVNVGLFRILSKLAAFLGHSLKVV